MAVSRKPTDNDDIMPLHLLSSMFTEYYLKGWNIVSSSNNLNSLHIDFQFQTLRSSQFNVGPSAAFCVQILQKLYENLRVKRWTIVSNNREAGLVNVSFTFEFRPNLKRVPSAAIPPVNHRLTKDRGSLSNVSSLVQLFEELKLFEEAARARSKSPNPHRGEHRSPHSDHEEIYENGEEEDYYEVPHHSARPPINRAPTPAAKRKPLLLPSANARRDAIFNNSFTNSKFVVAELPDQPTSSRRRKGMIRKLRQLLEHLPSEFSSKNEDHQPPAYTVVFPEQNGDDFSPARERRKSGHRHRQVLEDSEFLPPAAPSPKPHRPRKSSRHQLNHELELSAREKVLRMLESSDNEAVERVHGTHKTPNGNSVIPPSSNGRGRRSQYESEPKVPQNHALQIKTGTLHSNGGRRSVMTELSPGSSDSQSNQSMSVSTDNTDPSKNGKASLAISARVQSSNEAVELVCAMCQRPKSERFQFKPCPNCYNLYCSDCFWWCVVVKKSRCVQCYYEPSVKVETPPSSSTGTPQDDTRSRKSSKGSGNQPLLGRSYKTLNTDLNAEEPS